VVELPPLLPSSLPPEYVLPPEPSSLRGGEDTVTVAGDAATTATGTTDAGACVVAATDE